MNSCKVHPVTKVGCCSDEKGAKTFFSHGPAETGKATRPQETAVQNFFPLSNVGVFSVYLAVLYHVPSRYIRLTGSQLLAPIGFSCFAVAVQWLPT